jgi:hypothetical protein
MGSQREPTTTRWLQMLVIGTSSAEELTDIGHV